MIDVILASMIVALAIVVISMANAIRELKSDLEHDHKQVGEAVALITSVIEGHGKAIEKLQTSDPLGKMPK